MGRPTKDRLGTRYGRLLITGHIYVRGLGTGWKCACDCGKEIYAAGHNLDSGNTQSCGCLHRELVTTHGKTRSRVYVIWKAMLQRCENPNASGYQNYGERGINICARWHTFELFFEDMGDPPTRFTLERIDNSRGYEPENCRWANYTDQLNNRRNNRVIEAFGRKQTITQWSREMKIPVTTLKNRLDRAGMPAEQALRAPAHPGRKLGASP